MNTDNIIPSTLKVTASASVNIDNDLKQPESVKSLSELLNEEKEQETDQSERE